MKKIITILAVIGFILSGCSDSEPNSDAATMSYETSKGVVTYPEDPKIYADYYVGQLLYLEADVAGADMTWPAEPWTSVATEKGVANISEDMEAVAALEPELIITMNEQFYDQYTAIAPTILIPYGTYDQEQIVLEIGKILNKEHLATDWIDQFNEEIELLQTKIDNPDKTVGIVDSWGGTTYMYGANFGRGGYVIYNKLGLKGTPQAEQEYIRKSDSYLTIDGESLINYSGDVLFICAPDEGVEQIKQLPTYNDLDSEVIIVDYDTFLYDDPYSLNAQVDALMEIYESEDL